MKQEPSQHHRIVGIDPGSRRVGFAYLEGCGKEILSLKAESFPLWGEDLSRRLLSLAELLRGWLDLHPAQVAVVEEVFVHKSPRSALILGMARGVTLLLLAERGIPVHGISTSRVKRTIGGHGRASKEGLRHLLSLELGLSSRLPLDASDAVAVALTYFFELQGGASFLPASGG